MREISGLLMGHPWQGGALRAVLAHLLAFLLALVLWRFAPLVLEPPYPLWAFWSVEGGMAALFAVLLRCAPWWWAINALFPPLLVLAMSLELAPGWMAMGFVLLLLVYWNAHGEHVPLYLSNRTTQAALQKILERETGEARRVADLGSGLGGALQALASAPRVARAVGFESAPLPWLMSRLRFARHPWIEVRRVNFWEARLNEFDVVYAFLSPAPMPRLWAKLVREARRPMLLISNSFPIPGVEPDEIIELDDGRGTELFLYRLPIS